MSQGGYSHTTRATGTVLTAAIYNADHQNHIINQNPQMTGGYSDTLAQMQLVSDPGTTGAENLSTTLAQEIEKIRFQLKAITGQSQWYMPPPQNLSSIGGIGDNSIPLTKLSNTTQGKLMGRIAAGAGPWQEFDIPSLAALVPAGSDLIMGVPAAGGAPRKVLVSDLATAQVPPAAQGRLTLVAGTPVMSATINAQNTIRYTPYIGQYIPVWNGTSLTALNTAGELTQLTTDNTKSPAACVANSVYDIFGWLDGSTPRISRGPPWTSLTGRGTGAGTSELTRVAGVLVNAQAITNGPAANRGTYLGSIRTNSGATLDWQLAGEGAGGLPGQYNVWNAYNRVDVMGFNADSTDNWSYASTSYRLFNASSNMVHTWLYGLQEDCIEFRAVMSIVSNLPTSNPQIGIGIDNTTGIHANSSTSTAFVNVGGTGGNGQHQLTAFCGVQLLGAHNAHPLERSVQGVAYTVYADAGTPGSVRNTGIFMKGRF